MPATENNLKILENSGFDLNINQYTYKHLEKVDEIRNAWQECSDIEIPDFDKTLYPFQKQAVGFLVQHGGRALIADEMGCIAGNMRVTITVNNNMQTIMLRELYKEKDNIFKHDVYTKSFDVEKKHFVLNKINNILYKGVKPVYAVITMHNYIEATDDHIFFTDKGEKELKQLKIGDLLYIDDTEPVLESILYIMPFGETDVYDLQMNSPYHNFVANKIVVHNCGKTIETLAYFSVNKDALPVLIICPNIVKYNWQREIDECLHSDSIVINSHNIDKIDVSKTDYYIINYDIISKLKILNILNSIDFHTIVLDEVHYIKSY
jgi:hypothetical protein